MAVRIARDVLEQLRIGRYNARNGLYCQVWNAEEHSGKSSFRKAFQSDPGIRCDVCALGSLFTSFVNLKNVFTIQQVNTPKFRNMIPALRGAFDVRDLLLMEYAFEYGKQGILARAERQHGSFDMLGDWVHPKAFTMRFRGRHDFERKELERTVRYVSSLDMSAQRLRKIMINVIRNKGRFILPK